MASEGSSIPPAGESGAAPPPRTEPVSTDTSRQLLVRVLYMIVLTFALWILGWALGVAVVLQLVLRLVNGQPNPNVARFGASLGRYARQTIEFLTFASERLPFPFADWPETRDAEAENS